MSLIKHSILIKLLARCKTNTKMFTIPNNNFKICDINIYFRTNSFLILHILYWLFEF